MRVAWVACSTLWLSKTCSFVTSPGVASQALLRKSSGRRLSMSAMPMPPSPDELRARAAAIREELKELEATASVNRRPNAELAEPKRVRAKT